MSPSKWLFLFLCLFLVTGIQQPAQADWVDVTDSFSIFETDSTTGDNITIQVEVYNWTDNDIEGELRLIYVPADGTPDPLNGTPAGEDGSNPTIYFPIVCAQEGVIESLETVIVTMVFDSTAVDDYEDLVYDLFVEINDTSIDNDIFRKKISKTPEFYSGEGAIQVMPLYVTARSTQGSYYTRAETGELVQCGTVCDDNGENCVTVDCSEDEHARVKPIIVSYVQEEETTLFNSVPGYDGDGDGEEDGWRYAHDVYTAVSLDDGLTWKRKNVSRTALKSSFTLPNGVEYPGDSESQDMVVVGPYVLVTWVDKYCRSGDPWDLTVDGDEDTYQVTGSQKSVDYLDVKGDEDPRPDLGIRPYSCVWGVRGVLDLDEDSPDYGTIVWYKAEQLTTGRRDAIRNFNAGIEPVYDPTPKPLEGTGGFAVSWQEDPKGLKTGKGRGPGAGMSGACVNHKTDIWYSFINWEDFATVDEDFVSSSSGDSIQDGDGEPQTEFACSLCPYVYNPEEGDPDNDIEPGTAFVDLPDDWVCPVCGASKEAFEKDSKPHAEVTFSPPVRITDNAVCREREATPIYGHTHVDGYLTEEGETCDYYYEGGTTNQPLLWEDLTGDWECPKCGGTKAETFNVEAVFIKNRNEGAAYCSAFSDNPRVDTDGNYIAPDAEAYAYAYYTQGGEWQDVYGVYVSATPGEAEILEDGTAKIGDTRVYWTGEPLDGNTGASRPNLSLVNWDGDTLALIAYEETKGVGSGSDKEAAAMEQAAPIPLVNMGDGTWEAGFTNTDCRSCHYQNVVPRDRVIPVSDEYTCIEKKGGVWKEDLEAYFPYRGYPYITEDPVSDEELQELVAAHEISYDADNQVNCVKFQGGWGMYPRDFARIYGENTYYALPDHMPGWHQEALDCTGCHLPYNTKDTDQDGISDRSDQCPGTVLDDPSTLDTVVGSETCGCIASQDPDDPEIEEEADRFRHGKNVYYHNFVFDDPDSEAISHGAQINGFSRDVVGQDENGNDILWSAPDTYDPFENARRVRVVPNAVLDETDTDAITLGLLYKEGKDGQGAPADAILRVFKGGFDIENLEKQIWNLSSSTPYLFQDPEDAGNEDGDGDNRAGDGSGDLLPNRNTPKIEHYYWTDANLDDPTGYWHRAADGSRLYDDYTPELSGNPFENVFSTRLAIHGDTILAGFAYCVNWSAGKKAKDHYDFYIRVSQDAGASWSLPVNVSQLKNHEESVSDCRVELTPPTLDNWDIYEPPNGQNIPFSQTGAPDVETVGDFNDASHFFVGVGTKENLPQPSPNVLELEEGEIFLDVFYSRGTFDGDGSVSFETYSKENPKYVEGSKEYLDVYGLETDEPCAGYLDDSTCIPNEPNPAYPEFVEEFDWMAKGDAHQGDVQILTNPMGTRLYTIWEQELPITDLDGQQHFQGADVWFRKVFYDEPGADLDVNQDGTVDMEDGREITRNIGTTAYDPDFLWTADFLADHRITGQDYSLWKKEYKKELVNESRLRWTSK